MRTTVFVMAAFFLFSRGASGGAAPELKIRPPAVAGSFYPADPKELAGMVDGFLAKASPPPLQNIAALVAPHAGYPYSGPVAAWSYALLKGRNIERVVVIAPSHYARFDFSSVYNGSAYATPLGQVPVDHEFAAKLAKAGPLIQLSDAGHTDSAGSQEHALEVQLPFLQRTLGQFHLVPIVMGDQSYESSRALGVALAKLIHGSNTLIVASSDLSHYHPYDEAVTMDHKTLHAIEEWDYLNLSRNSEWRVWEACGGGPIVAAMIAAERLGASSATILDYANSGDTAGDRSRVVGYGAVALTKGAPSAREETFTLTRQEKDTLLEIARKSVETAVRQHKFAECPRPAATALNQERGAFVTLTKDGKLRGCIGYFAPIKPLYLAVRDVAAKAAVEDSRFPPVTPAELTDLEYEISVLSPFRHVQDVREIHVGLHGLLIHSLGSEGLLLPQVATDERLDRTAFLELASRKAGLPQDAWLRPETDIFRFTALVFGEHKRLETLLPSDLAWLPWTAPPWPTPLAPGPLPAPEEQSLEVQTMGLGRR